MTKQIQVREFLSKFHEYMKIWDVIFLDERGKNFKSIAALEISPRQRLEVLAKLSVEDYSEGPLAELVHGWTDMWVFGKVVKSVEIYIKITLGLKEKPKCICISFHPAERPMSYPFK